MATLHPGRHTTVLEPGQELVLFLIGLRLNKLLQVRRWLPVLLALPPMLKELRADPSLGLLGSTGTFVSGRTLLLVQHWRSFADLERYARAAEHLHLPAWRHFNARTRGNGAVGIFHETYRLRTNDSESLYVNMPAFGLGRVGALEPVGTERQSAAARLGVGPDVGLPVVPEG